METVPGAMHGVIYVRTADGGTSTEPLIAKCRAFAVSQNLTVDEVFQDQGYAGFDVEHRPGLLCALQHIRTQETHFLLAPSVSNLSRSASIIFQIQNTIKPYECRVMVGGQSEEGNYLNRLIDAAMSES